MFTDAITKFIFAKDVPQRADLLFLPGSPLPDLALHAAELYSKGYAPLVLPSGKYSITADRLVAPQGCTGDFLTECEYLTDLLQKNGVPPSAILQEKEAAYTYQNAVFSRRLLEEKGILVRRAILVCQAFHARRCLMYYQEQFPDTRFFVCPVVTRGISRETWRQSEDGIRTVLGELSRIGGQFEEIIKEYL